MSCNGCRILRKGCKEDCILRQSLLAIESPLAQSNATVFVAKFFGRAGLISFLSSVPQSQRPALFQSLLFEACGRTVNPVKGAAGLPWTGNWHVCQSAVETVLRGGIPRAAPPEYFSGAAADYENNLYGALKRRAFDVGGDETKARGLAAAGFPARMTAGGRVIRRRREKKRLDSPSDESETTTLESGFVCPRGDETKLLPLFF